MPTQIGSNAPIPYVAPWAAQFNRYSTQILTGPSASGQTFAFTVPANQWWRLAWASCGWSNSATAANRLAVLEIDPPGTSTLFYSSTTVQVANLVGFYTWGVGLNAFATVAVNGAQYFQIPLSDVMLPAKTVLTFFNQNPQVGDGLNNPSVAVEIYTEFTASDNSGDTLLLPSPVLT